MKGEKNNIRCKGLCRILCVSLLSTFLFSLSTLMTSCSTQKARWANIQYHNTTCHYNVWWNGKESLKEARRTMHAAAADDYTRLLAPEPLGTEAEVQAVYPQLDRAIEKGVKGILKHSIYVRGEEHVPYIKECYLLTAYASFYKQDYLSTTNTCNILLTQFPGTRAADEGAILLARCMACERRFTEAESTLDQLYVRLQNGQFSRSCRERLHVAMVEATLPQEKYKKAVDHIHLALDASGDRSLKARLTFLLAQIYRHLDRRGVAAKYYHQVLRYRPPYIMEFNARLGEASCADPATADIAKLERSLDKLFHDKKNVDYRDQILYAKGEMYLGIGQRHKAVQALRSSVALATTNKSQKALSSLRLGEVLYDTYQDYDLAQCYYDTVMQNVGADYPRYRSIKRRADMLEELCSYTRLYERHDSLIHISSLPEEERLALINAKIDTLRKHEEEERRRQLIAEYSSEASAVQNSLQGDWYFYNAKTVSQGKEAFRERWGMRPLEDLWFLTNKTLLTPIETPAVEEQDSALAADTTRATEGRKEPAPLAANGDPNDPHAVAYYLKDLPTTPEEVDSLERLTAALLGAAYIFYDGVGDLPRALQCYHRLAADYVSSPDIVQAFYMLYRIYDRQGNTPQANYYRDMVLMGFPDSDFANLIRDNEYYKQLLQRDRRIDDDYESIYRHYQEGHYAQVVRLAVEAEEVYYDNPRLSRFLFWHALSLAHRGDIQGARTKLQAVMAATTQQDTLHSLAEVQLTLLENDSLLFASDDGTQQGTPSFATDKGGSASLSRTTATVANKGEKTTLPPEALVYRYREKQQHYVIILADDRTVRATELQYRIADFNSQYYSNAGLKVDATLFTDTSQLLTIHRFLDAEQAMGYYRHLLSPQSPLQAYSKEQCTPLVISTQNYATFYNRKTLDAYNAFFKQYYLESNKK